MVSAVFYGLALTALFFFTVGPWLVAAGGSLLMAAPFIVGAAAFAFAMRWLYRRSLASEQITPGRRSRRRIAFAVTLLLTALPICGLCAIGIMESYGRGAPDRVEYLRRAFGETEAAIATLEQDLEEEEDEYRRHYIRNDLTRNRQKLPHLKRDLRIAEAGRPHAYLATIATIAFLAVSIYVAASNLRQGNTATPAP